MCHTRESAYPELPKKLSRLVQFPTVSSYDPHQEDGRAFSTFLDELPLLFPTVFSSMKRELPSDRSLLLEWEGKDASLAPVLLCAHFDVVPATNAEAWTHPPFSGAIADNAVWGRGTQDIKELLASMLEAAEQLLRRNFQPRHTIYFAFGGDEEVGGTRGAASIAVWLDRKAVRASFLLDEGGPISSGLLSFVERPVALIAVAEKGYVDFLLTAKGEAGHASMPPKNTAPGNLARAIAAIESHPPKARLTKTLKAFLASLAPHASQPYRFIFSHLGLTAPAIKLAFGASPSTNALIRTTVACTMLSGSEKENVLAESAEASLNVRLLPGDSSEDERARLSGIVRKFGADLRPKHEGHVVEASTESDVAHEGWSAITGALSESHPEALCAPFLFSAATDTKHYAGIVNATYRFTCLLQTQDDLKGVHAQNERVRLEDLDRCALFYGALMERL